MASMVRIVLHRIPSGKLTPSEPLAASSFDSHTQIEFSCGGGLRNCNSQAIFRRRRRRGTSSFQSSAGRTQATDGYSDEDLPGLLLARSGLGSRAFRSGFWSEPEPPPFGLFGLFGLFGPTPFSFKMTHIEAKSSNIWLRYDPKLV